MEKLHDDAGSAQPPQHPVSQLQGPFEESMMESVNELEDGEQNTDSVARRKMLLQGERYERVCAGRWKQRPGEKFHPLWKLSAQLSFGIHLLAQGLAKSDEEVMRILQSHVDDIDGFLERTTEDFDLAQSDVDERLRYLRLPLEHVDVFDHMLDDRTFRTSIVEGNEKIEHIVERTSEAMKDALKDVQKGIDATGALGKYLTDLKSNWTDRTPELEAVYVAMLGNVEGWTRAFMDLHLQGNRLAVSLGQLAGIVAEMQRRAGVASRKVLLPYSGPTSADALQVQKGNATQKQPPLSPGLTSPRSPQPRAANALPNKPLPIAPDLMIPARQASRAKLAHDEKLRRRSMDILREKEKAKAAQTQSGRKASMAEKVRSVTKRGSSQALSAKAESPKPSDMRSSAPSKMVSPPIKSPKVVEPDPVARSPARIGVKERSPQRLPSGQANGAIELPAEVPLDNTGAQEPSRKGGLHIHLGSKHRNKEQSSGPSPSKSLNIFRRSPHSLQPPEATTEPHPAETTTLSPKLAKTASTPKDTQQVDIQLSPPPDLAPQRSSPDPGLPTPPALVAENFSRGVGPNSYTALPSVLATARRATAVRASLRVSVPSSSDPEPEKTPRAIPFQPSESVHKAVTLTELPSNNSQIHAAPDNESKHTSFHSNLREPGPELPTLDTVPASEQKAKTAQDDEKTPTTGERPQFVTPRSSPTPSQEARADTPLTSATMRSYSDFYKLPPQQTSPTPPPMTPEGSVANQSIASSVASSVRHSKTASYQGPEAKTDIKTDIKTDTKTETEPSKEQPEEQLSEARSPPRKNAPAEKEQTNPKDLQLKPRNKDLQNQSKLLDLIASTAPQSPIHTRGSSEASALNAVGTTSSASRILAPPEEAPPPPAPGGRSMIIPDYATAGAFEGERKPKRGSGMSTSGWKKMFAGSGGSAPAASTGNSVGVLGVPGSRGEDEEIHMSANLMSGQGNDVLWYKGMGKDGLWVSGA